MKYRKLVRTDKDVSVLGFGCMRFPTIKENGIDIIDEQEAIKMLRYSIDNGVNYIDTAYFYHNHQSELLVGKALKDGYREKVFLATKSPVSILNDAADFEKILNEQLKKLQTDTIDYYLFHALCRNSWNEKVLKFDLLSKIQKVKQEGKIRHIGFSFHDDYDAFQTIIDGFDHWEFCQIQLNYTDVNHQAGIKGLEYAASKGIGVVIMEPLRGGRLAAPPPLVKQALPEGKTPVNWALDFLWNRPEVSVVLSGMSTMEQITDNLNYATLFEEGMLSKEEVEALLHAGEVFNNGAFVPCTKCEYCLPCPFAVSIPEIYTAYNMTASHSKKAASDFYEKIDIRADQCTLCKTCESACPQQIKSSELMPQIAKAFAK